MGFEPVATDEEPFTCSLDDNGFVIEGLYINRPDEWYVGLFGHIGTESVINDLGLTEIYVEGSKLVGGLVGWNRGTIIHYR